MNKQSDEGKILTPRASKHWLWGIAASAVSVVVGILLAQTFIAVTTPLPGAAPPAITPATETPPALQNTVKPKTPAPTVPNFAQIRACVISDQNRIPVTLYVADNDLLRQRGLQNVSALPRNTGMMFVYNTMRSATTKFWMYKTLMNLDIAYLDAKGLIRTVQQMPACSGEADTCPRYQAGVPFLAAVEFPQGFFRKHGITVGDRISADYFSDCQVQ